MKKTMIFFLLMLISTTSIYAQVTVGDDTPPAATLDVVANDGSTPAGVIAPRLTLTELAANDSKYLEAQTGAIVYVSDASGTTTTKTAKITAVGYYYFDGTVWQAMKGADWHITGNAGTNPDVNFLGTTDDQPLVIKVAGTRAGYISNLTTSANYNAIGLNALAANTGIGNNAFGYNALSGNNSGYGNSAFGYLALQVNSTGFANSAFGYRALEDNIDGIRNTGIGFGALYTNISGDDNVAVGTDVLLENKAGSFNTGLGYHALNQSNASNNTGVGNDAFGDVTTGANNTALGSLAGNLLITGSNNIIIGYNAQASTTSISNQVTIGNAQNTSYRIYGVWTNASDRRLKHDIKPIAQGLSFVKSLKPVEYVYNNGSGKTLGFVAQDVEESMQEANMTGYNLVQVMQGDTLGLNTTELLPVLTKAIQEQQTIIEKQQNTIDALLLRIEAIENKQ